MSLRVEIAEAAIEDLFSIWASRADRSGNPDVADRVRDTIETEIQGLADRPGIGHTRRDVSDPRYRFWRIYRFLIAYRVEGDTLYVARVVPGERDFRRLFR